MAKRAGPILVLMAVQGLGCSGPSLDLPTAAGPKWSLELDPKIDATSTALSFRARVQQAPAGGEPWLFKGEVSAYHARALQRGEVPKTLRDRAVPLRFWRDADDCVAQPVEWLEPNADYTLAYTGLGILQAIVARTSDAPRARRIFPPEGSSKHRVQVLCDLPGEAALETPLLEPGSVPLRIDTGVVGQPAPGCATLTAESEPTAPVVSPVQLAGAWLDPSAWLPASTNPPKKAVECAAGTELHGACVEVSDDRVWVTPLVDDLLWSLSEPQSLWLATRAESRSALLRSLIPGTELELRGVVLSSAGKSEPFRSHFALLPARRHLVLNEVLANPLGPEPASEWIELVNDSERPASLAELWLEDASGHVTLPDAELGAGEFALLVGEDFRASSQDVPISEGVRLIRLTSLGARGLANGGEALLLVGAEGVVSRFPALAAAHAGRSLARRTLDVADDDPAGFAEHGAPGASPGAPNSFAPTP